MKYSPSALVLLVCGVTALNADVIVSTNLNLTSFSISPSIGVVEFLTFPNNGLGITSAAFASVSDSFGDQDFQFNSNTDGATSAVATIPFASASATADSSIFTTATASGVHIPTLDASAGTDTACCYSQIYGFFQIDTATPGTASVDFSANLSASQSLATDYTGVSAFSETTFQMELPDLFSTPFLFFDHPLSITGPNQSALFSSAPALTNSATLQTNTPYFFLLETDSESNAVDSTPEPNSLALAAAGFMALLFLRTRQNLRRTLRQTLSR